MEFLSSFATLAPRYDAFILDLWGVIHDGQTPYPGALECLRELREAGKKIALLSNAPRRARVAAESLLRMGVADTAYDALITSGEAAYRFLATEPQDLRGKGGRYIYIGLDKDRNTLAGLSYKEVEDSAAADFVLLTHSFYDNQPLEELKPVLDECHAAGLPLLCINPDTEIVRLTGERVYCAGVLAADYAARGGKARYFGKPHAMVYEMAFAALSGIDRDRMIAVGDNLATDIAGARANSIKSALVTGGVLKEEVGEPGTPAYRNKLNALLARAQAKPDYALAAFKW